MKNTFVLADIERLLDVPGVSSDRVVIISVIGKSPYNSSGVKTQSIGRIIPPLDQKDLSECTIEGSYDQENQIVYLHLYSLLDADAFLRNYEQLCEECITERNCDDFLAVYDEVKSSFARYLLLLFHISHIVVLSHPTATLDTNYIQYFKAVDSLSQKLFEKITHSLKSVENISSEWVANGRFCTPRLIFHFERCPKHVGNVKKLEHNLEDKIYHILKKTRIISTTGCSLLAMPLNDEFVYISEKPNPNDRLGKMVRGLIADCQPGGGIQIEPPYSSQPNLEKSFKRFLQTHIHQAKTKGFDDIAGSGRHQHAQAMHFELPVLGQWIEATQVLRKLVVRKKVITSLCTDTRFSEQRCLKVLPLALARYQEGLPSHYAKVEHEARLDMALTLFRAQARGPCFERYADQLEMECQAHWENGRQQCEMISMTGNPCKLPKHSAEQEHMSGFIYKAICNCGRRVGPREDPYNAKQANYSFYKEMSKECQCAKLERVELATAAAATASRDVLRRPEASEKDGGTSSEEEEEVGNGRDVEGERLLDGMLTMTSKPGFLPVYSSWSLVCLGASSLYSHNLGLSESHHPGFLSSTNYLLPWDVTVYSKTKQTWPHVGKYTARGRRGRPAGVSPQFTVKVFIGMEYECSSGHRFMLASPDKMLKALPGSLVKDTGHKIAENDMPLYYPCACRAGRLAQLMRLHVVTPKAPVHCTLDPKVQPAPGAPVFVATNEGPIKLTQSAYWILRLPYVYVADTEHYVHNPLARLLHGVFGVTETE